MPMLSRAEMLQVLSEGGAVAFKGEVINNPSALPTDAEIAMINGDPEEIKAADERLRAQVEELQAQLAMLVAAKPEVKEVKTKKSE